MASATAMMKLPAVRAGQIKNLAAARGMGLTETIEFLLNLAVETGDLPDVLPGFEVKREGSLIVLTLEGQPLPGMLPDIAKQAAHNLEYAGTAQAVGKGRPVFFHRNGRRSPFEAELMFAVGRHGSGVVVALEEITCGEALGTGKRITAAMTRGMAVDLARQIHAAINTH